MWYANHGVKKNWLLLPKEIPFTIYPDMSLLSPLYLLSWCTSFKNFLSAGEMAHLKFQHLVGCMQGQPVLHSKTTFRKGTLPPK